MITIKKNDYVKPTEIREEVVKAICDAFMSGCCDSTFHPFSDRFRYHDDAVFVCQGHCTCFVNNFHCKLDYNHESIKFHGCEMKEAFRLLIEAGYHMFRIYSYGTWMGYRLSKYPFYEGGVEVFSFDDVID